METIVREYTVYNYNELSESAKETAKQWYLNDPWRSEDLTEQFRESFINYWFPNSELDVQWSLSSCQGDGVNIYGKLDYADIIAYIQNYNQDEHGTSTAAKPCDTFTNKELRRLQFYFGYSDGCTLENNHRYCYCIADRAEVADEMIQELEYSEIRAIDTALIERFENVVEGIVVGLCRDMETMGYNWLYEVSDEEMKESCDANEWSFNEDGTFFSL